MVMFMDVDKLQKMNVLADTLKQHGLAATREDAANLAGSMVGTNEEQGLSRIFVEPEQKVAIQQEENEENDEDMKREEEQGFGESQVKNILQNFADQFCAEINKLNDKVAEQSEQIAKFEAVLNNLNSQPAPQQEPAPEPQQPEPVQQTIEPKEEKTESPRSGGYSPNDVSIEKIFYYGQK